MQNLDKGVTENGVTLWFMSQFQDVFFRYCFAKECRKAEAWEEQSHQLVVVVVEVVVVVVEVVVVVVIVVVVVAVIVVVVVVVIVVVVVVTVVVGVVVVVAGGGGVGVAERAGVVGGARTQIFQRTEAINFPSNTC